LFNQCFVFAINQGWSVIGCWINNASVLGTVTSQNDTVDGVSLRWCFINGRGTYTIGNSFTIVIQIAQDNLPTIIQDYMVTLTDLVASSYLCLDETSWNNTNKVWSDKSGNNRNVQLSSTCATQTYGASYGTTGLTCVKLVGGVSNVLLTQTQASAIGYSWSYFAVCECPTNTAHTLASVTPNNSTTSLVTFGGWNKSYRMIWWLSNGGISPTNVTSATITPALGLGDPMTNWTIYSFFLNNSVNGNPMTYFMNRCDANILTSQPASPAAFSLGHDCQTAVTVQNGSDVFCAFFCVFPTTTSQIRVRCIEYVLWKIYNISYRYTTTN
jgi:hypothetical protein